MPNAHPTSTAGDGKRFRQFKFRAPGEPSETNFFSCPHCGFRNNAAKVPLPSSDGSSKQYVSTNITIPGGTRVFLDPTVTGGCVFCGLNYTVNTYKEPFFSSTNLQGR